MAIEVPSFSTCISQSKQRMVSIRNLHCHIMSSLTLKQYLRRLCFGTLMIGVMITGCSRNGNEALDTNNALIGSWQDENGKTLIFKKDGTFNVINHKHQGRGTYTMIDPTQFRISISFKDTNSVTLYKFSILGKDMTLESVSGGTTGILHRVQN